MLQFLILHRTRVTGLSVSVSLQPGHLFFFLKYAIQTPQFIPQGATREYLFKDLIVQLLWSWNNIAYLVITNIRLLRSRN